MNIKATKVEFQPVIVFLNQMHQQFQWIRVVYLPEMVSAAPWLPIGWFIRHAKDIQYQNVSLAGSPKWFTGTAAMTSDPERLKSLLHASHTETHTHTHTANASDASMVLCAGRIVVIAFYGFHLFECFECCASSTKTKRHKNRKRERRDIRRWVFSENHSSMAARPPWDESMSLHYLCACSNFK